jgi:hypothetical protein
MSNNYDSYNTLLRGYNKVYQQLYNNTTKNEYNMIHNSSDYYNHIIYVNRSYVKSDIIYYPSYLGPNYS